jgi:hypothetical protein
MDHRFMTKTLKFCRFAIKTLAINYLTSGTEKVKVLAD